jgi:hypothetical protein
MKIKISPSPFLIFFDSGNIYNKVLAELHQLRLSLNYFFAAFIIFFPISESFPQNFFPLQVGNAYQIKNFWAWWGPGGTGETGTDYYAIAVVADTIIDGEIFFRYSNNALLDNDYLFNYDSLNQKVYVKLPNDSTIRLGIDFNAPSGSSYTSYLRGSPLQFTSEGIINEVVLGDTHYVYSMQNLGSNYYTYKFADNIGISYFYARSGIIQGGSETKQDVVSSIIDSLIYSPIVLDIDTIYPIQDRPIDTFPFLLTIAYTSSYSQLINSFYLSVEHVRNDTLVQSLRYNISRNNPHITLNLSDLLVGDKIKFRATITDSSIFFNVANFPDTGWVVMNILPPILSVENENNPLLFNLAQNYPNPFNPSTRIRYQIPEPVFVTIKIFDVLGNEIETLVKEVKIAGSYEIEFDGSNLTSGIYYYKITAGEFSQTNKMVLIK